ncbi:MAG: hypothetical protein LUD77_01855 [Clostridiales bacterium]|nr:hypothetical protein [Clostridiales bacterium]
MREHKSAEFIFLLLTVFIFTSCGNKTSESKSAGAYADNVEENNLALKEAKINAWHDNPDGQEFIFDEEGIYIMFPDEDWTLSSQESGCLGFSDETGIINIYYSDDDGSVYNDAPQNTDDVAEILTDADISEEWFEIVNFDFSENNGIKNYSYMIKFNIPDDEGNYSEFYSISKSVCTGSRVYIATGQIYDEKAVSECETAVNSFAVF